MVRAWSVALMVLMAPMPSTAAAAPEFIGKVEPISEALQGRMRGVSFHEGCPVPFEELRLLTLSYIDPTGAVQQGELVVNRAVAQEMVDIFRELFEARFPIEKMQLVLEYKGSDDASCAANNTSAFNCRKVTGSTASWSNHALGRAIDINPLWNPYVKKDLIVPPKGSEYLDRKAHRPGMIQRDDAVIKAFKSRGWKWGGDWRRLKDYQHFEKKK
jgi:hypothetical protein